MRRHRFGEFGARFGEFRPGSDNLIEILSKTFVFFVFLLKTMKRVVKASNFTRYLRESLFFIAFLMFWGGGDQKAQVQRIWAQARRIVCFLKKKHWFSVFSVQTIKQISVQIYTQIPTPIYTQIPTLIYTQIA